MCLDGVPKPTVGTAVLDVTIHAGKIKQYKSKSLNGKMNQLSSQLQFQCVHTACASFPVLVADSEDFLHTVIHGFGKPAELLTFLLPVDTF